ncbi:hypothetical protein NDU88_006298 [Pleurodeles waltl]|uniref:Uncharacterized protein n=1 Tax=Pleurodeles waltl TaxID=8319 RepID=A0AAV7X0V9_PLEWA|nr:hypothetical protein NDU88_006298 [Pleurodeles waltl]
METAPPGVPEERRIGVEVGTATELGHTGRVAWLGAALGNRWVLGYRSRPGNGGRSGGGCTPETAWWRTLRMGLLHGRRGLVWRLASAGRGPGRGIPDVMAEEMPQQAQPRS